VVEGVEATPCELVTCYARSLCVQEEGVRGFEYTRALLGELRYDERILGVLALAAPGGLTHLVTPSSIPFNSVSIKSSTSAAKVEVINLTNEISTMVHIGQDGDNNKKKAIEEIEWEAFCFCVCLLTNCACDRLYSDIHIAATIQHHHVRPLTRVMIPFLWY